MIALWYLFEVDSEVSWIWAKYVSEIIEVKIKYELCYRASCSDIYRKLYDVKMLILDGSYSIWILHVELELVLPFTAHWRCDSQII